MDKRFALTAQAGMQRIPRIQPQMAFRIIQLFFASLSGRRLSLYDIFRFAESLPIVFREGAEGALLI